MVVTIDETIPGAALDKRLRREQAKAPPGTDRRASVAGS